MNTLSSSETKEWSWFSNSNVTEHYPVVHIPVNILYHTHRLIEENEVAIFILTTQQGFNIRPPSSLSAAYTV